jgi:alpha-D-ribose 1-methylphosphonate 5-phosphate C-P lyase
VPCALCGATESFLDEVITDDAGTRMQVCSDSHYCQTRQAAAAHSESGTNAAYALGVDERR